MVDHQLWLEERGYALLRDALGYPGLDGCVDMSTAKLVSDRPGKSSAEECDDEAFLVVQIESQSHPYPAPPTSTEMAHLQVRRERSAGRTKGLRHAGSGGGLLGSPAQCRSR